MSRIKIPEVNKWCGMCCTRGGYRIEEFKMNVIFKDTPRHAAGRFIAPPEIFGGAFLVGRFQKKPDVYGVSVFFFALAFS